jgi:hypothetical protein
MIKRKGRFGVPFAFQLERSHMAIKQDFRITDDEEKYSDLIVRRSKSDDEDEDDVIVIEGDTFIEIPIPMAVELVSAVTTLIGPKH